jgi:phosphatidylserine synthase
MNIAGPVAQSTWIIPVASVILSLLLVSEIPMFSMKFKKGAEPTLKVRRITFLILAAIALILTLILGRHLVYAIFIIFTIYIMMNLIHRVFSR